MSKVNRCAGIGLIICAVFAMAVKSQTSAAKIDSHSVWKPSVTAASALTDAATAGKGTQETLLAVMKDDHASAESVAFATSFSTEGAYLSAIDANPGYGWIDDWDG